jgi:hypothetical protein
MSYSTLHRTVAIVSGAVGVTVGLYFTSKSFRSVVLSSIDYAGILLSVIGTTAFHDGVVEVEEFHKALNMLHQDTADNVEIKDMVLKGWQAKGNIRVARGTFLSPIADHLPHEKQAHIANIEIVIPKEYSWEEFLTSGKRVSSAFNCYFDLLLLVVRKFLGDSTSIHRR